MPDHEPHRTRLRYTGEARRCAAMPLGGLGAGSLALHADGSLRQWQIFNQVNHNAYIPDSFFAVRARIGNAPPVARMLLDPSLWDAPHDPAPHITDHVVPDDLRRLLCDRTHVQSTEMVGEYPIAEVSYMDTGLPVDVRLEAFSPMIPLDDRASGLPAALFIFHVRNPGPAAADISLLGALQNAVSYDGCAPLTSRYCSLFGGNVNRLIRLNGLVAIDMQNERLPADDPRQGSMTLAVLADDVSGDAGWVHLDPLWHEFVEAGALGGPSTAGRSPRGETINGALCVHVRLEPGEEREIPFLLAWHFPNRVVNWDQTWLGGPSGPSKLHIGNWYATWLPSALAVADYVRANYGRLVSGTRDFREAFYDSTLPLWLLDAVGSQMSTPRSPTCLRTADGNFFGFEGCQGGSTWMCCTGCCPLNCTHVWNYELTLARLFPAVERTMREVDLFVQMNDEGGIPHRTVLPLWLPRWNDQPGSEVVACDGHFGTLLKAYREWLACGDRDLLDRWWPAIKKAMDYAFARWDADGDGLLDPDAPQWNTYDLNYYGWNTFCSSLYHAALRATEEMAGLRGDAAMAAECRRRFESGRALADERLFNGEYYEQIVDAARYPDMQYGPGCLADQLFGQWFADLLDLGALYDPAHIRAALAATFRHNFRPRMEGHLQQPRIFASDDEGGLLTTTWPRGGRPEKPMYYSDEVWTGIEYRVAAQFLTEGMADEAAVVVAAARARYDGRRRNPWNEIECGDHYARAMSGWSLLEAAAGFFYSAPAALLRFAPRVGRDDFRAFFVAGDSWGVVSQMIADGCRTVTLSVHGGSVALRCLELSPAVAAPAATIDLDGRPVAGTMAGGAVTFADQIDLRAGSVLSVTLA